MAASVSVKSFNQIPELDFFFLSTWNFPSFLSVVEVLLEFYTSVPSRSPWGSAAYLFYSIPDAHDWAKHFFLFGDLWHGYFCLASKISVGPISSKRVLALALNMPCLKKAPWVNMGGLWP